MRTDNLTRADASLRRETVTVHSYDVDLDLSRAKDAHEPTFQVSTRVVFDASATETFIDFTGREVTGLVVNGEPRDIDYNGYVLALTGLAAGRNEAEITATAVYSHSGEGLHRFTDTDGQVFCYTQYEPADSRRVFPNFDQPDLKASFRFAVTAPAEWTVLSNQPEEAAAEAAGCVRHEFGATLRQSSYLTCIIAGPYARFTDHWSAPDGSLEVPLGVYCRTSLAEFCDADAIFTVTKQGLDFFHERFGYPYPWGKYDQVFVPEYNLGAMENPGCVTFTDHYIFRSPATRTQYERRASTILHEMAHMWFGDLVTPRWWDELWLKESFAEFMGTHACVEATEFTDSWVAFGGQRKAWALRADQLPTTHPISADIVDLEAAKQNFDGITYAKGAAVLKQLVAFVGEEEFFVGCQRYFATHEFSSTVLDDLLVELEAASGRDLAAWSRAWLQTAGVDLIVAEADRDDEGRLAKLVVRQTSIDAITGAEARRPHRLNVAAYEVVDSRLRLSARWPIDVDGDTEIPEAVGTRSDVVFVNESDLSYLKTRFDASSFAVLAEHLASLEDALTRAQVWGVLLDEVRDGERRVVDIIYLVERHAVSETEVPILENLLGMVRTAVQNYLSGDGQRDAAARLAELARRAATEVEPGSGRQLAWARLGLWAARLSGQDATWWLSEPPAGLVISPEIRWAVLRAEAAHGRVTDADLDAEQARDDSSQAANWRLTCEAARPDAASKAERWERMHTPGEFSNAQLSAVINGFTEPSQSSLRDDYVARFFDSLQQVWRDNPSEMALRLVKGLYPFDGGAAAVEAGRAWLDAHPDAPTGLRQAVREAHDDTERDSRNRAVNASQRG